MADDHSPAFVGCRARSRSSATTPGAVAVRTTHAPHIEARLAAHRSDGRLKLPIGRTCVAGPTYRRSGVVDETDHDASVLGAAVGCGVGGLRIATPDTVRRQPGSVDVMGQNGGDGVGAGL